MGNAESSCYTKEDKRSDRPSKQKSSIFGSRFSVSSSKRASTSSAKEDTCPTTENNEATRRCADQASSSSDEAYTPVRKEKKIDLINVNQWDPRSPTEGIARTPIQPNQECVAILDDPRSPTAGINRTPIVQPELETKPTVCTMDLDDPRFCSAEINRTPLNGATGTGNLRRAVLLSNTLKSSPLSGKPHEVDELNAPCVESTISDGSFFSAQNVFVDNDTASSNKSTAVSPALESDTSKMDQIDDQVSITANTASDETSNEIGQDCSFDEEQIPTTSKDAQKSMEVFISSCSEHTTNLPTIQESPCCEKLQMREDPTESTFSPSSLPAMESPVSTCTTSKLLTDIGDLKANSPQLINTDRKSSQEIFLEEVENSPIPTSAAEEMAKNIVARLEKKSSIPALKGAERKRRVNPKQQQNKPARRQNDTTDRKKDVALKKLDSQSTRSPLSVLGHSNSPEPKRIRQTNIDTMDGLSGRKSNRSRLPRSKLGNRS